MKVLIFEFITGGGFAQEELPESLFNEGLLMLTSLVNELDSSPSIQLTVLLDWRCKNMELPHKIEAVWVSKEQNVYDLLPELIETSDYVWPIAPEMGAELQKISALVENKATGLLNSSSQAVAVCGDKFSTYEVLQNNGLPVVETMQLNSFSKYIVGSWVIKLKDGVGCLNCSVITNQSEFDAALSRVDCKKDYIIQPYVYGESLSLSCLFRGGVACLLCCNRQQISIRQGKFQLEACQVNIPSTKRAEYQKLINEVAKSISGLWGYVGIDIIQTESDTPLILEINPRLTTSYTGIYRALGLNIGEVVVNMIDAPPVIRVTQNIQYNIKL